MKKLYLLKSKSGQTERIDMHDHKYHSIYQLQQKLHLPTWVNISPADSVEFSGNAAGMYFEGTWFKSWQGIQLA